MMKSEILEESSQHLRQKALLVGRRRVHHYTKPRFDRIQKPPAALARGESNDRKGSLPVATAHVGKAQKVEASELSPSIGRRSPKGEQAGLLVRQFKSELLQAEFHLGCESAGFTGVFEASHESSAYRVRYTRPWQVLAKRRLNQRSSA